MPSNGAIRRHSCEITLYADSLIVTPTRLCVLRSSTLYGGSFGGAIAALAGRGFGLVALRAGALVGVALRERAPAAR
jgi:putative lipase involved disintegration of autophagic bodies